MILASSQHHFPEWEVSSASPDFPPCPARCEALRPGGSACTASTGGGPITGKEHVLTSLRAGA